LLESDNCLLLAAVEEHVAHATLAFMERTRKRVVRTLDGTTHTLWNGSGAALEAAIGSPVALHLDYAVLAVGRTRFNVAVV